jgi:ABC-2 type transport system permease protein
VIAAILRAQFLSMRMTARRGAVLSFITGILWYGLWLGIAGAMFLAARFPNVTVLGIYLPLALLGICLYWQMVPIFSASMGSSLDLRKLLLYPVPHGKLFLVEVLLRLTTGLEMVMVLAGGVLGLARNPSLGGWAILPRLLPPVLIFIVFNLLLASGLRSVLERLLARRKVREFLFFLILLVWMAPRVIVLSGYRPKSLRGWEYMIQTLGLPWNAAARAMLGDAQLPALLSLCAWTALAAWFGRRQFERSLRYDPIAAQATPLRHGTSRWQALADGFFRFPSLLWRDPLAAIVEKELRSLSRAPRFRMVFVMGFSFGLMVWLPLILGPGRHPALAGNFLTVVCIYSLTLLGQVSYWNCFGFDRSATQFYFAAPQPFSRTLIAKNIAALVFIYMEALILTGITVALRVAFGWGQLAETFVVLGICSVYMLALGNVSSVQYPRSLSPERVSHGGASSRFQALVFIFYPLALLPVGLAYLARYAFDSQLMFALVLGIAAIIGGVLYWIAMDSAVSTAERRREKMLEDLSRGEGPVVSD